MSEPRRPSRISASLDVSVPDPELAPRSSLARVSVPRGSRGLVVQTAWFGDVVLTTPLIRRAAERTGSPVDVIVVPQAAEVLANNPHIRDIIPYDKNGKDRGVRAFFELATRLKLRGYQIAYLAQASPRSALLTWAARIPRRIGFRHARGAWFYTHTVVPRGEPHQVERLLSLADGAPDRREPEIYPSPADRRAVDEVLGEAGIEGEFITLAPGSAWGTKRWPYYPELARALAAEIPIALVGGAGDRADARAIRNALGPGAPLADGVGRLSLLAAGELIRRATMLVSNDSAPVHLASATGTPTVEIYGPTLPGFGFAVRSRLSRVIEPEPLPCRPCHHHGPAVCPQLHHKCMRDTAVGRVLAEVRTLLQIVRSHRRHSGGH
jgi:heptosyltransferase-2